MTDSKKNVIIVSARRSGTHLMVDLLVNNYGYESINYNYIDYKKFTGEPLYPASELKQLEIQLESSGKVMWSHAHDYRDYAKYNHKADEIQRLDSIFKNSKIILVYRDIRDIISSCYSRPRVNSKYESFQDFYNNFNYDGYELIDQYYFNFTDLLIQYYKNWFSVYMSKEVLELDMEIVSFEEIVSNYSNTLTKLDKFLNLKSNKDVDVRLPNKNKDLLYTTNDFYKGKIGEWKNVMEVEFGENIKRKYDIDIGIGLDYFLNDIKIHKFHTPNRETLINKYKNNKLPSPEKIIQNRYSKSVQRSTDFRYYHKVFYFDEYVLKFISPCKASLNREQYNKIAKFESYKLLNTIIKTNDILYSNNIVPKLHYTGMHNGMLYVIQEKCPKENTICEKYNLYPQAGDWSWINSYDLKHQMLAHFYTALSYNIVLTDLFNVYNSAFDKNGKLKYFDLDGIAYFDSKHQMLKSQEYKHAMSLIEELP